jgi:methyl-accepting chemotaxis protein
VDSIGCLLCSSFVYDELTKRFSSPLTCLLERGLYKPEKGENQMSGQRNGKYAAAVGMQLLAKIHCLESQLGNISRQQNHPIDKLSERIDFIGNASDRVGGVVDELNSHINAQEVQVSQLADMVNDLVGKTEGQAKVIKEMKSECERHRKIMNTLTAKVISLEQCAEDLQKKAFPNVRESSVDIVVDD